MYADEMHIGEQCDRCKHTTKITNLLTGYSKSYFCKCNHPSNESWWSKLKWILAGKPAIQNRNTHEGHLHKGDRSE